MAKLRRQLRHMCDLDTGRVIMYAILWLGERGESYGDGHFLESRSVGSFLRAFCTNASIASPHSKNTQPHQPHNLPPLTRTTPEDLTENFLDSRPSQNAFCSTKKTCRMFSISRKRVALILKGPGRRRVRGGTYTKHTAESQKSAPVRR